MPDEQENMNIENSTQYNDRIWISWESQRRTITLSREFNTKLFIVKNKRNGLLRYPELMIKTARIILREKPKYVFAQNPSIVLAALVCFLKKPCKFKAIIDRHTNFKLNYRNSKNLQWIFFKCISNYSLSNADHTIVTNKYLKLLISNRTKKISILPDKIPSLTPSNRLNSKSSEFKLTALFICTFADDEPFRKVFDAFKNFPEICLQVTGNYNGAMNHSDIKCLAPNIKLLGFVSNQSYIDHLFDCDFTVILTNQEFTLNCGAYESLAAKKPMLLSDTKTIRSYFTFGANYTKLDSLNNIRENINSISSELEKKEQEILDQLLLMEDTWEKMFSTVETCIVK